MEDLRILATRNTPEVTFLPQRQRFLICGNSIPENAGEFYSAPMEWLRLNIPNLPIGSTFEFSLPYFNSSSLKALYLLLLEIKQGKEFGKEFHLVWYAENDDEFMIDAAETFIELTGMDLEVRIGIPE